MGSIKRRGESTWTLIYRLPRDKNGKRKQKWESFKGNKREAEQLLKQREVAIEHGTYIEVSKQTLAEFLEQWLVEYAAAQVSPTTLRSYTVHLRRHVIPRLGQAPLAELTTLQIQRLYTELLESGRKDGAGGLARQTVHHIHTILNGALGRAVKWRLLTQNPCEHVEPPRVPRRERPALSEAEVSRLLQAVQGTKLAAAVYLALGTGLRRGEVLGLTWSDLDLEQGELVVRRSVIAARGHVTVKEPKNDTSARPVPLPEFIVPVLRRHKGEQAKQRLLLGEEYRDRGIVVAGKKGDWLYPDTLTQWFAELMKALELEYTFHDLRRTYISLLNRYGVELTVIARMVGHSNLSTTDRIYTHVRKDQHRAAANRLDEGLKRAMGE